MCTGRGTQLKGKRFVSWPQRTPVIKRIRPGNRARILCFFSPPLALSLSFSLFLPLIYPPSLHPLFSPSFFSFLFHLLLRVLPFFASNCRESCLLEKIAHRRRALGMLIFFFAPPLGPATPLPSSSFSTLVLKGVTFL